MPSCLVDFDRGGPLDSSIADRRLADGERPVSNMNFRRAEIESFEHGAIQSMMDQLALVLARLNATAEQNGWVPGTPPHAVPSYWLKGQVRAKVLLAGQKRKQARHTSIQYLYKSASSPQKGSYLSYCCCFAFQVDRSRLFRFRPCCGRRTLLALGLVTVATLFFRWL